MNLFRFKTFKNGEVADQLAHFSVFASKSLGFIREAKEFIEPAKMTMMKSDILTGSSIKDIEEQIESIENKFYGLNSADSDEFDQNIWNKKIRNPSHVIE